MIAVTYDRANHRLTAEGHAYSGEAGHDLVCAAASMLAYTLARAVTEMDAAGAVTKSCVMMEAGRTEISCRPGRGMKRAVEVIFRTICGGFDMLAATYPENVKWEIR